MCDEMIEEESSSSSSDDDALQMAGLAGGFGEDMDMSMGPCRAKCSGLTPTGPVGGASQETPLAVMH